MFGDLKTMRSLLQQERYYRRVEDIREREKSIMERWGQLLQLLGVDKLETYYNIITLLWEIKTLPLTSQPGRPLLDVQEKLQSQVQTTQKCETICIVKISGD